jgi:hypothetical protein
MCNGERCIRDIGRRRSHGVTYLLLLALVAATAVVAAHALQTGEALSRRAAERELLNVGAGFEDALRSHGARPRALQELLRDPRTPGVRRHLRRIPLDPLTGKNDWGLLRDAQGGIVAVFSLAPGRPLQRDGFTGKHARFNGAERYTQWTFGAAPDQSLRIDNTSERNSRP